ncbi:hypothetical protein G6F40_016651 [Rhizopus arrhizus]|nr:hypothetical protein G6F40_016651 [Rhizopus arrhizus]
MRPGRAVPVRGLFDCGCLLRARGVALYHLRHCGRRPGARLHGRSAGAARHAGMDARRPRRSHLRSRRRALPQASLKGAGQSFQSCSRCAMNSRSSAIAGASVRPVSVTSANSA